MKRILMMVMLLCLLCTVLLSVSVTSAAENLAVNGDLEMGSVNGWETPAATLESNPVHGGDYSLKLAATDAYTGAAFKTVPVRRNATVTVTFYYRYASAPGSKLYHVYTYMGADPWTGAYSGAEASFSANSITYSTWKQVTYTFNSGQYDAIYLKFCPGGSGGTVCYIDDLVVTSVGGDEPDVEPYLTSFGTKYNRPKEAASNLIKQGGFESADGASWNAATFIKGDLAVVSDTTAPEGDHSLCFNAGAATTPVWHTFSVAVEKNTRYTFSAWVKSPRLSTDNRATATFGVMNAATGEFLVYEPYNGHGHGVASLSTKTMQLMTTAPDGEWHLRSVTFDSGSHTTVAIGVYGARSQLYLDDLALFKSSNGVEYISPLRTETVSGGDNSGYRYCADEDSLIEGIYMTTNDARLSWSDNPAWRNGFLSFADVGESHGAVLKYTASAHTEWQLHYIDWIDVKPNTSYTLTLDVKRVAAGGGRIALLDDNVLSPAEFYTIPFSATDSDWVTYSVTFDSGVYSRVGFAIVDGGGSALIDEVRLFETSKAIADKPIGPTPTLKAEGGPTSVMEMSGGEAPMVNSDFEGGTIDGWVPYQQTVVSEEAAYGGYYGIHLRGNGTWGALVEQWHIPVIDGKTYTLSYWYKTNAAGANVTLKGATTGTQYAYMWVDRAEWTHVSQTFTVTGDTTLTFNACGGNTGVAEDVYLDSVRLIPADSTAELGVAFMVELEAYHVTVDVENRFNAPNATVIPYGDGVSYRLLRMGAVLTNQAAIGTDPQLLTLDNVNRSTVEDIPAVYLFQVTDESCHFAVRVVNVPMAHCAAEIYARPYYVFEKDGEEIVVYGDIYSRSYDG